MKRGTKTRQRGAALLMLMMVLGVVGAFFAMRIFGSGRQHVQNERTTHAVLVQASDALLGFAAVNDRLPCPASATSNGFESFCTNNLPAACGAAILNPPGPAPLHGRCTNPYDGFFPAATVGLPGVNANGFLVDGWGGTVRYAVATVGNTFFTTATNGLTLATVPDLWVCGSATGITGTTCGTAPVLASNVASVIFSLGSNGLSGVVGGIDETANLNNNQVFVSHPKSDGSAANGEFDDLLIWLPMNTLTTRMIQAGRLP